MEGVDNLSILCYNIGMEDEIESFYLIFYHLSGRTRPDSTNPQNEQELCQQTVCGSSAHRKNPTASPSI